MDSDNEEYEYEEDEEYEYEDYQEEEDQGEAESDGEREKVASPTPTTPAAPSAGPEASSSSKKKSTPKSGSCLRQTSGTSYELVIPYDSYVIRSAAEIRPLLDALVSEISALLSVSPDEAQALLQFHKWDKERLMEKYFSDDERTRRECGLDLYSPNLLESLALSETGNFDCKICYEHGLPLSQAAGLGCRHLFCRDCYGGYLASMVSDGPSCVIGKCAAHKCKQLVPRSYFHTLLGSGSGSAATEGLAEKYDEYVLRNFVEMSKNMKYCPAPRCDRVSVGSGVTTIRCTCGHPYCFKCGEEAHDPCSCSQLSDWALKCTNESETANWILANTRKCPNCQTRIEKNQGCNHMTCKVCKHEFCWICMGNWSEHNSNTGGFYKCNRYEAANANAQATAAQKAKAELDRYLHYYQRFHGHNHALKFAATQREAAEKKMLAQQESQKSSWVDVEYVKAAAEQLIDCRRVLKYTYVMGYFLQDNTPEKSLFEHHQELLEKNTERLHECTELAVDKMDRTQVVNLTRVTERFMVNLLESLSGGIVRMDHPNGGSASAAGTGGSSGKSSARTKSG